MLPGDVYPYTGDLLELDSCHLLSPSVYSWPPVSTPLVLPAWEAHLADHPDQRFAAYVLRGIARGFRVGFNHRNLKAAVRNMQSATEHPEVVDAYIEEELCLGRTIGPLCQARLAYKPFWGNRPFTIMT